MSRTLYLVDYPRKSAFAESALIGRQYDYDRFISCPVCGRQVSGAHWVQPREVVLTSRKVPDFLYQYGGNTDFLLSERALEVIRSAGLTGIVGAQEIELVRFQRKAKKEVPLPRYYFIELARSRITVDHAHSVIRYGKMGTRETCQQCQQVPATYDFFRKLVLNMEADEGYDIFQTYELGDQICLSQRFLDICRQEGLTNLHCTIAQDHNKWMAEYFLDGNEDA